MRTVRKLRLIPAFAACLAPVACVSTAHVVAFQEVTIPPAPRTFALLLDQAEKLPFGLSSGAVVAATTRAGFTMREVGPQYRLALTAAAGSSHSGSYVPGAEAKTPPSWIARPDHNWRTLFAKRQVLRVTAVLVEANTNREVWRGTGTLLTADPRGAAPELVEEVLAKLPKG